MPNATYLKVVSDNNLHIILQRVANLLNKNITVHSGDRNFVPPGGSTSSLHMVKRAADFHISGMSDADGFDFFRQNMNRVFDVTEAYEFIHHGFYTGTGHQNKQTGAGGQHLHIGHYGRGGYVVFKVEGLIRATKITTHRQQYFSPRQLENLFNPVKRYYVHIVPEPEIRQLTLLHQSEKTGKIYQMMFVKFKIS